jgi:hypothetical protein
MQTRRAKLNTHTHNKAIANRRRRQFQIEATRPDVREQLFTAKATRIVAQGALRRAAVRRMNQGSSLVSSHTRAK